MSYDVSIWCTLPFQDGIALPDSGKWTLRESAWSIEGKGWIINTGPSERVLPEDIPEEVNGLLPGIEHAVHLSLEPIDAPKVAFTILKKAAKSIAKAAKGAVFDPQQDSVELPAGMKRYSSTKRKSGTRVPVLEIRWWFEHSDLLEQATIERFLDLLEAHLPEAMPRRYGLWEPPPHQFEKTGRAHLVEFLKENLTEHVVWYAHPPLASVHIGIERSCGWRRFSGPRQEYRCNDVTLVVNPDALDQPGWQAALSRAWRILSVELRPFFGDVRTLNGYSQIGSQYGSDAWAEPHPVKGWFWRGIPPRLGHAAVVGSPYLALWPELATRAELADGLAFIATPDWRSSEDAADLVGGVPPKLALPFMPHRLNDDPRTWEMVYPETYPAMFPFGEPPH